MTDLCVGVFSTGVWKQSGNLYTIIRDCAALEIPRGRHVVAKQADVEQWNLHMAKNLKDIAEELGLSISTISRVVNGKKYVSPKTSDMVKKALERNNYLPNQVARSLKVKATNTIGIIVPDIRDYFANVIRGADAILSEAGYSIILADSNEDKEKEDMYIRLLHEKRVDGLILATVSDDNSALQLLQSGAIPVVFIDNLPNLSHSVDAVLLNNYKASCMALEHLVRLGHRNIAIICGDQQETTAKERLAGYTDTLESNGIIPDPSLIKFGGYTYDTGHDRMLELLDSRGGRDITAVFATSYKITCGAIRALKERRIHYPDDISLVGFDFVDEQHLVSPTVTSILQPIDNIGKLVAHRIVSKIKANADKQGNAKVVDIPQKILLDPILEPGESTSPPKA